MEKSKNINFRIASVDEIKARGKNKKSKMMLAFTAIAIVIAALAIFMLSNKIPNKSIIDHLGVSELSKAIKKDSTFAEFYNGVRSVVDSMEKTDMAKFSDITYRELFIYTKNLTDSSYWTPLIEKWEKEWTEKQFLPNIHKADSSLSHWNKFMHNNEYVKVVLASVDSRNVQYLLSEVITVGISMTPLNGNVDNVEIDYIYDINKNGKCVRHTIFQIDGESIDHERIKHIDILNYGSYELRKSFLVGDGVTMIVKKVIKNGKTISVPQEELDYLYRTTERAWIGDGVYEATEKSVADYYKEKILKRIDKKFDMKSEYIGKKVLEVMKENKECFDFVNFASNGTVEILLSLHKLHDERK